MAITRGAGSSCGCPQSIPFLYPRRRREKYSKPHREPWPIEERNPAVAPNRLEIIPTEYLQNTYPTGDLCRHGMPCHLTLLITTTRSCHDFPSSPHAARLRCPGGSSLLPCLPNLQSQSGIDYWVGNKIFGLPPPLSYIHTTSYGSYPAIS